MSNLILVAGLSGSGKTYYCHDFIQRHPDYTYLNIDDFYTAYNGKSIHENEFEVWITFFNAIHSAGVTGKNVIVESNALDAFDRVQFVRWFPEFKHHYLYWVWTDCWTALANNKNRSRVIPEKEWWRMYQKVEEPDSCADQEFDAICFIENKQKENKYNITKPGEKE